jgi:lysophospholipase L1-like esterase
MNVFALRRVLPLLTGALLLLSTSYGAVAKDPVQALVQEPALDRFETAVSHIEDQDRASMPAPGGTVFVGSSTFAHWTTMEAELKDLAAINRGFGGSTLPEVNHYFDRLVAKYKPARIVLYAGTNDIADGHSGEQVAKDVAAFLASAHKELPQAEVYFISMSMPPSRVQWAKQYIEGNRLVSAFAEQDRHFHYIDVTRVMYDSRGVMRKDYFGDDNLHMNKAGYAAWVPVIRQSLAPQ